MSNPPPFKAVAQLVVTGTDRIFEEADRRLGRIRTKLSPQEEDEMHEIWSKLTELVLQLYQLPSNKSLVKIGAKHGGSSFEGRYPEARSIRG